ncbi:tetratricopeptide repeat protein [Candidatus Auribacterota bacterium]
MKINIYTNRITLILALIIVLCIAVFYCGTFTGKFICDDNSIINENPFTSKLSNLKHLFTDKYFDSSGELTYRPVGTLSYFLDYAIAGHTPFWYRLHNLILHMIFTISLMSLLLSLKVKRLAAFFGALIFALHPINVESVCVPSFREEVYAGIFFIWALLLLINRKYFWAGISFFLALLSKEMAVSFILIAGLYELLFRQNDIAFLTEKAKIFEPSGIARRYAWILMSLILYLFIRFSVMYAPYESNVQYAHLGLFDRLCTQGQVFTHFVKNILWPVKLDPEYIFQWHKTIFSPDVWPHYLFIITIILLAVLLSKKRPVISLGIFWFYITLLPVSNIFPLEHLGADRYLYIPMTGFSILIAGTIDTTGVRSRKYVYAAAIILAVFFGILTFQRAWDFNNPLSLWTNAVKKSPNVVRIRNNYSNALFKAGKIDEAEKEFNTVLKLHPDYPGALRTLGYISELKGNYDKATAYYKRLLKICPKDHYGYYNLGNVYQKTGRTNEAINAFNKALECKDDYPEAYINLGVLYNSMGEQDKAVFCFEKAVEIAPYMSLAYNNLGVLYYRMNMPGKARKMFLKALELNRNDKLAARNLNKINKTLK